MPSFIRRQKSVDKNKSGKQNKSRMIKIPGEMNTWTATINTRVGAYGFYPGDHIVFIRGAYRSFAHTHEFVIAGVGRIRGRGKHLFAIPIDRSFNGKINDTICCCPLYFNDIYDQINIGEYVASPYVVIDRYGCFKYGEMQQDNELLNQVIRGKTKRRGVSFLMDNPNVDDIKENITYKKLV